MSVAGLILAAGRGRRMGRDKARLVIQGRPALTRLAEVYLLAGLDPVVLLAGPGQEDLAPADPRIRWAPGAPEQPMSDSIRRGLALLPGAEGAVIQPVDAPFTELAMIQALLAGPPGAARALAYHGAPGHPVYLPRSGFALLGQDAPGGLGAALLTLGRSLIEWEDAAVLADLDTPDDLLAWEARLGAR